MGRSSFKNSNYCFNHLFLLGTLLINSGAKAMESSSFSFAVLDSNLVQLIAYELVKQELHNNTLRHTIQTLMPLTQVNKELHATIYHSPFWHSIVTLLDNQKKYADILFLYQNAKRIKSCREAMGTYSASLDCQKWGDAFPEFSLFFKNPTKKNFINNYTCLEFFIENNVLNGSQIALIKSTIERINTLKKPTESICFYTYLIKQAVLNHYARNKKVDDIPTFIELIRAGNAERALSLFATSNNKKMIAKEQDAVGITSLMAALYLPTTDHSQELIKQLIQESELEAADTQGFTALHHVAWVSNVWAGEQLLLAGANPNSLTLTNTTPLAFAAQKGSLFLTNALLSNKAISTTANRDQRTALSRAAIHSHENVVTLLTPLYDEKTINIYPTNDMPPLLASILCVSPSLKSISSLLGNKASPMYLRKENYRSPLAILITRNSLPQSVLLSLIKVLLDTCPALINLPDCQGNTPLLLALHFHPTNAELIQLILRYKPDIMIRNFKREGVREIRRNSQSEAVITLINEYILHYPLKCTWMDVNDLCAAIKNKEKENITDFLNHEVNVNVAHSRWHTLPLKLAIEANSKTIVKQLLDHGAYPYLPFLQDYTLFNTLVTKKLSLSKLIFEKLTVYGPAMEYIVVHTAEQCIREDNADLLRYLLKHHTLSPEYMLSYTVHTLGLSHLAAGLSSLKCLKTLIEFSADLNQQTKEGRTPLIISTMNGSNCINYLLEQKNIDITVTDKLGRTAANYAWLSNNDLLAFRLNLSGNANHDRIINTLVALVQKGNLDAFKHFIEKNPHAPSLINGRSTTSLHTPLTAAIEMAPEENLALVEYIFSLGANPKLARGEATPLTLAAAKGHSNILKYLLLQGVSKHHTDFSGNTPLMAAAFYHQEKIVDLLLKEYQVNPNQIHPEHGRTALIYAAQEGYLYIAKTLIKYNANPTIKCVEGKTAHDYALENGHDEVAHYLEGIQNEQRAQADFLK